MKKNWFLRIGLIALVLAIATTCLVGGTFAKYTTTVSGNDTIEVARFGFNANDGIDGGEDNAILFETSAVEIDLFGDADTDATGTVVAGNIAPGVGGSFLIVLDATTTDVDLVFDLVEAEDPTPDSKFVSSILGDEQTALTTTTEFISYKIAWGVGEDVTAATGNATLPGDYHDKGTVETADIRHTLADLDSDLTTILTGLVIEKNTALVIKVEYEWVDAEANDTADTAIAQGIKANTEIGATVTITASQKMTANGGGDYTTSGALADDLIA